MSQVDAVSQDGVFKPLTPVVLPENQRVHLEVQPVEGDEMLAWMEEVKQIQQPIIQRCGYLPDSTPDIAEDRLR